MTPLLVTRPRPDADRTVSSLVGAGVAALPAPLMTIRFAPVPLPDPANHDALVFTSANGVRAWAHAGGPRAPAFAVGPATAAEAEANGHRIEAVGGADIEALLSRLLEEPEDRRFLHVRGVHGRGALADRLAGAGRACVGLPLYEAIAARALPPDVRRAFAEGGRIGVFSPRTMGLLCGLAREAGMAAGASGVEVFCLSGAIARAADLPFSRIAVAGRPELPAFVDMVRARDT